MIDKVKESEFIVSYALGNNLGGITSRRRFDFPIDSTKFVKNSYCNYSGTSDKGPSKKGTTSLQNTLPISPTVYSCMELIYFQHPIRGQPPYKGQNS